MLPTSGGWPDRLQAVLLNMPKIFLLSKEELFTNPLYEFLKSKGTDVVLSENPHDLGGNISHLVVVNLDGKFSENQTLLKYLAKSATGLKVVVVNSAPGLAYSVTPVKQIFIDNILGLYDKPLRELYTKALKPEVYLPTKAWLSVCSLEEVLDKVAEELFSFSESKSSYICHRRRGWRTKTRGQQQGVSVRGRRLEVSR